MTAFALEGVARTNRRRTLFGGVFNALSIFRAARECALAVEERRRPSEAALRTLGIDADVFNRTLR